MAWSDPALLRPTRTRPRRPARRHARTRDRCPAIPRPAGGPRYSRGVIFKRVGDGRPYPDHGLSSRAWAAVPPRQVRLDELVTTKDTLQLAALLDEDSTFYGDLFAHVVEWRGRVLPRGRPAPGAARGAAAAPRPARPRAHRGGLTRARAPRSAPRHASACCSLLLVVGAAWGWSPLHRAVPRQGRRTGLRGPQRPEGREGLLLPGRRSASSTPATAPGLAGRTMELFTDRGFQPGRERQRPRRTRRSPVVPGLDHRPRRTRRPAWWPASSGARHSVVSSTAASAPGSTVVVGDGFRGLGPGDGDFVRAPQRYADLRPPGGR